MKSRTWLLVAASVLFAGSHFLPSYDRANGFDCLKFCWEITAGLKMDNPGTWVYYAGFLLTAALFPIMVARLARRAVATRVDVTLTLLMLAQVLSWWVVNVVNRGADEEFSIRVGYYVWAAAFALLAAAAWAAKRAAPTGSAKP